MYTYAVSDGVADVVADSSTRRVVVVDESHTQLAFYERSVAALSAELQSFSSPEEALDYLRGHTADIVLLDLAMTGQDGLSWLRDLRHMDAHEETPVVVITSKDYAQDRSLARKLGALDYLVKPLTSQEIRDVLNRHGGVLPGDTSEP